MKILSAVVLSAVAISAQGCDTACFIEDWDFYGHNLVDPANNNGAGFKTLNSDPCECEAACNSVSACGAWSLQPNTFCYLQTYSGSGVNGKALTTVHQGYSKGVISGVKNACAKADICTDTSCWKKDWHIHGHNLVSAANGQGAGFLGTPCECEKACDGDVACTAWVHQDNGFCYLQNVANPLTTVDQGYEKGSTTGIKGACATTDVCYDNCWKSDYHIFGNNLVHPLNGDGNGFQGRPCDCDDRCRQIGSACTAWTHQSNGYCYLHDVANPGSSQNQGYEAGSVVGLKNGCASSKLCSSYSCFLQDYHFFGHNLNVPRNNNGAGFWTKYPCDCEAACNIESGCTAWTWQTNSFCYLQGVTNPLTTAQQGYEKGSISGIKNQCATAALASSKDKEDSFTIGGSSAAVPLVALVIGCAGAALGVAGAAMVYRRRAATGRQNITEIRSPILGQRNPMIGEASA